jgi:adenosine deaminase
VVYAEIFFDPQGHTSRGVAFDTIIDGLQRARREAEASLGIRSELIMCFLRDMSAESALETLEQSLPHKDGIIGVGLDSDERGNPPTKFKEVFARARDAGYRLTMHCDVDQENSVDHIWQCLNEIGVERIDHGVNALEDDALIEEIKSRGLGLTVCPISNGYVTDGLKSDEVKRMLDRGVRVTINSDDPAYFLAYVNENLIALHEAANLTRDEMVQLAKNGFTISWLPEDEKERHVRAVEAYAAS